MPKSVVSPLVPRLFAGCAAAALLGMASCSPSHQDSAPPAADATATPLALPLTTGPAPQAAAAPASDALPPAPPPPRRSVGRPADAYGYVDQAYAMSSAIGEAPPDYAFDYDGARPWVWRTATNALRVSEQTPDGDRSYYFQPGASDPYLIDDGPYAYAFADGGLVAIYDADGRLLSPDETDRRADRAGRCFARARALRAAALERQREAVNAANWAARRAEFQAEQRRWADGERQSPDWRAYHSDHDADQQAYWRDEAARRSQSAAAYDHWSHQDYQGPAPVIAPPSAAPAAVSAGLIGAVVGVLAGGRSGHDDHRPPPQDASAPPPRGPDRGRPDAPPTQPLQTPQGPMQHGPMERGPMTQGPAQRGPAQQGPAQQGSAQQGPAQQGPAPAAPLPGQHVRPDIPHAPAPATPSSAAPPRPAAVMARPPAPVAVQKPAPPPPSAPVQRAAAPVVATPPTKAAPPAAPLPHHGSMEGGRHRPDGAPDPNGPKP